MEYAGAGGAGIGVDGAADVEEEITMTSSSSDPPSSSSILGSSIREQGASSIVSRIWIDTF